MFGLGAVSAALLVAGRVAGSQGRMAVTLALLGGGIVLFSIAPWLPLGFVFLAVAGFGYLASNTSATTRLQLGVAESHRGRIMALWSVAFLGLRPLASLADGGLAATIGVRGAGIVLALPALARRGPGRAGLPEERVAVVARRRERLLDRPRRDPADQVPHRARPCRSCRTRAPRRTAAARRRHPWACR